MRRSGPLGIISNILRVGLGDLKTRPVVYEWNADANHLLFPAIDPFDLSLFEMDFGNGHGGSFSDNSPGDILSSYQIDNPTNEKLCLHAFINLFVPMRVSRVRYRFGTKNQHSWSQFVEASNDGVNWVSPYTGVPVVNPIASGTFQWYPERNSTQISSTPYQYWRVFIQDDGSSGTSDARISDFRLYDRNGILINQV